MLGDVENGSSSSRKMRASTIQQRFGFVDSDLKTPLHDEIVVWLDGAMGQVLSQIVKPRQWNHDYVAKQKERAANAIACELRVAETLKKEARWPTSTLSEWSQRELKDPPPWAVSVTRNIWEFAIVDRSFTVGFVDMKTDYSVPDSLEIEGFERRSVRTGVDATSGYERPVYESFEGLAKWPTWHVGRDRLSACFEVKTSIPSLGEVIRQIRMYQTYEKSPFFIVCPDTRFAAQLKSQKIGFIEYPSGAVL